MPDFNLFRYHSESWHPEIEGWSTDILPFYERIAKDIPDNTVIIEIGVHHGRSLLFLAELLRFREKKNCTIFAIDRWENKNNFTTFQYHLEQFDQEIIDMIVPIQSDSCDIDTIHLIEQHCKENNKHISLIFIDADHSYEAVKNDINTWLTIGTIINQGIPFIFAGHDYWNYGEHAGVGKAVDEKFPGITTQGSVWYTYNTGNTPIPQYEPLISIIILCHKQLEFLEECLISIANQSYKNWEIIIGLGDNDLIESHINNYISLIILNNNHIQNNRIIWIHNLNKGIGHAINTCIDSSISNLIIRVDADDTLSSDALHQYITAYSHFKYITGNWYGYPLAIVTSNYNNFNHPHPPIHTITQKIPPPYFPRNITDQNHFHTSSMFTKDLWKTVGEFSPELTAFEDWEFWIRCCTKNPLVIKVNANLLNHRIHANQATTEDIPNTKIWEACIEINNPDIYIETREAKHFLELVNKIKSAKQKDLARIRKHIKWYPESQLAKRLGPYLLTNPEFNGNLDIKWYPESQLAKRLGPYLLTNPEFNGNLINPEFPMKSTRKVKAMSTFDQTKTNPKVCLTMIVKNEIATISVAFIPSKI